MMPKPANLNLIEEELGEMKKSMHFIIDEIRNLSKQQETIIELVKEVKELKHSIEEKDKKIGALEVRVADLEQYSRINDVTITGEDIKPLLHARATASKGEATQQDTDSAEQQVLAFLASKEITLYSSDIEWDCTVPV